VSSISPIIEKDKTGFVLNNFHRTETKAGKKLWEVTAKTGEYITQTDSAKLTNALIIVYQKNGDIIQVESEKAILQFDNDSLIEAFLEKTVKLNVNKEKFVTTEKADFNKLQNTIVAPGYAKIEDRNVTLEGELLNVDLSLGILQYGKKVKTLIKSDHRPASPSL
ncbi:MAG: LPS export ABC transporter periplasmic protein LptC, partial [bacterium]|nr:LPS export ABC transporter periplasmic protein LptC [bacterium]